jgi:RHS repeat-associated protein
MVMPGRTFNAVGAKDYRFGFNGKENDNEIKGVANQQDYGERIYDPRIGKFLSVDPIAAKYPELTPFQFASNRPIDGIDLDGLEFMKIYSSPSLLRPLGLTTTFQNVENFAKAKRADPNASIAKVMLKASWMTAGAKIHTGLDVAGLVPLVGEVPDAINGGIYLLEKDYHNAAFSFAATVPFFGWASTTTKWAKNALKFSGNAFYSSAGLVFKKIGKENRLAHVLEHTVNNIKKNYHGVFEATSEGLVGLLDDAYSKVKSIKWNTKLAVGESETVGGVTRSLRQEASGIVSENFVVDMGRKVGTEGGKKGSGEALNKVQISVVNGTSDVITAFPTK